MLLTGKRNAWRMPIIFVLRNVRTSGRGGQKIVVSAKIFVKHWFLEAVTVDQDQLSIRERRDAVSVLTRAGEWHTYETICSKNVYSTDYRCSQMRTMEVHGSFNHFYIERAL